MFKILKKLFIKKQLKELNQATQRAFNYTLKELRRD